jgi:hypothetical protein
MDLNPARKKTFIRTFALEHRKFSRHFNGSYCIEYNDGVSTAQVSSFE